MPEPPRRTSPGKRPRFPHPDRERAQVDQRLLQRIEQAEDWPVVLLGPAGVGKTYAALCVGDEFPGSARYTTVAECCEDLIAVQQGRERWPNTVGDWWQAIDDLGLLILDELGSRSAVSDHHYEVVKRILDRRDGRPMIVISNADLTTIGRLYDSRIASRLAGGTVIDVKGKDRRVTR